ncbi:hypothetical protein GCM10010149_93110 [Nonomuraea roseoviolacea subsp. roseoviolacea]|uniref:hypothetical protein n=1 Tax=Nonomuraea roseoviolacea TaxID=103837 RepID=UPI0031E20A1F
MRADQPPPQETATDVRADQPPRLETPSRVRADQPSPSKTPAHVSPAAVVLEAARDNAAWCDAMCRAHGLPGRFTAHAWTNPRRTPPYYPDAVTLSPSATEAGVLGGIDAGPGASVKDSFAALDLTPYGFHVLFEARWLHRPAAPAPDPAGDVVWGRVRSASELREWERACFGGEADGLFPPSLLEETAILYGRRDGAVVCGCVLTLTGEAVGVSNVFASGCDDDPAWAGTVAQAARLFPGRDLVGYEADTAPAERHGFTPTGPLRVWLTS